MNGLNKQDISWCVDGSPAPAVQATAKLDELIVILNQLQERDARCIDEAITTVMQLSNIVPESAPDAPGNQPQPQKKAGYGGVYTREQFTEFYGETDSQWWWDEAESAPDSAPLNGALALDLVMCASVALPCVPCLPCKLFDLLSCCQNHFKSFVSQCFGSVAGEQISHQPLHLVRHCRRWQLKNFWQ